jgi:hypothetical protein
VWLHAGRAWHQLADGALVVRMLIIAISTRDECCMKDVEVLTIFGIRLSSNKLRHPGFASESIFLR